VRLSRGRRFGGAIAELAVAVRDGQADRALDLLRSGAADVSFLDGGDTSAVQLDVVAAARVVTAAAELGDVETALAELERHRLLCAHRHGPYGVGEWDRRARGWVSAALGTPLETGRWYPGQPLLVTENDHDARVYNGDTGVVVRRGEELLAAFARGSRPVLLHPGRLAGLQTVYAMTIHRSQGSQYDTVSVVLPATASSLLTRELLYTAITRARTHVRVLGTEESVPAGIGRQVLRASGLRRVVQA
jgi:exodeoxyribonuclease V alpha subunit